jgi:hypothetical protein
MNLYKDMYYHPINDNQSESILHYLINLLSVLICKHVSARKSFMLQGCITYS